MLKKPDRKVTCCDCGKKRDAFWPIYQIQRQSGEKDTLWCCRQCFRDHGYADHMGEQGRSV